MRLEVKIDDLGSPDAVASLSNVTADASSSTGAAALTFSIDFGDGTISAGPTARHTYATPGTFTIAVTARDNQGRTASDSRQISVKSVTGRWFEAEYVRTSRRVEVRRLTVTSQEGLTIGGLYQVDGARDRSFTGTLSSPRNVRIALDGGASLEGSFPGRLNDEAEHWSLQAHGDTVDGERLEFRFIPGESAEAAPDADLRLSFDNGPDAWAPFPALTPVQIDASLSRGSGLLYFVEFGDGVVASTAQATHVVDAPPSPPLTARVTVVDRFGRSDAESSAYSTFDLDIGMPLHGANGGYWYAVDYVQKTSLRLEFLERNGINYVGEAEQSGAFRAAAFATLSGQRDIRITVPAAGVEYRGTIQMSPGGNAVMTIVQTGGAQSGRTWALNRHTFY